MGLLVLALGVPPGAMAKVLTLASAIKLLVGVLALNNNTTELKYGSLATDTTQLIVAVVVLPSVAAVAVNKEVVFAVTVGVPVTAELTMLNPVGNAFAV
jgi:hypothetical protein